MTALPPADNTASITSSSEPLAVVPAESVPNTDVWTVRLVVVALTSVVVLVIVGQVVLSFWDRTLPDALLTLGAVAVGGLGSMLVSTRSVRT